jgi:predicted small metal-binding protein
MSSESFQVAKPGAWPQWLLFRACGFSHLAPESAERARAVANHMAETKKTALNLKEDPKISILTAT